MSAADQQQETQIGSVEEWAGTLSLRGLQPSEAEAAVNAMMALASAHRTLAARLAAAETARDEAIARATRFYETATRAVTSRHAAETALRRADKIASKAHDAMWAMDFDKTSAGSVERRTWVGLRKIASDHIHKLHGVVRPVLSASPEEDRYAAAEEPTDYLYAGCGCPQCRAETAAGEARADG